MPSACSWARGSGPVITSQPPNDPELMECVGLTASVTEVAVNFQRLLFGPGSGRVIASHIPDGPEVVEGVGLAEPVAEVTADHQRLFMCLRRSHVIARQPPHGPEVVQGVDLAAPFIDFSVGGQCRSKAWAAAGYSSSHTGRPPAR